MVAAILDAIAAAGRRAARNAPYAGAYSLDRHGDVAGGIHAVQIEVDRALYLAPGLREPGEGLAAAAAMIAAIAAAAAGAALACPAMAAE